MKPLCLFLLLYFVQGASAQSDRFPFTESFDRAIIPTLPAGWSTTSNRAASGDFVTTTSTPHSDSNAVISTNATIGQSLTLPALSFSGREADSLLCYERRSSTHNSGTLFEASTDGGIT